MMTMPIFRESSSGEAPGRRPRRRLLHAALVGLTVSLAACPGEAPTDTGTAVPAEATGTPPPADDPVEARIDALIAAMTLDEKLDQICGKDFMDGNTNARLGIPPFLMTDGPHGVRENFGQNTCFPTLITIGATWDPELTGRFGVALAKETRARGRNLILGPCINIHRTPLGGRNFESMGEDPWLTSRLAVAYVKGVQSQGIGTSTKHFAANNQEWDRNRVSVEIDERALREIYLPAFRAAVTEAGTFTVMGAYNRLNGHYCCESRHLLEEILKNEWGFRYVVLSDWWAIKDNVKAALNGCDMEMPGPAAGGYAFVREKFLPAVRDGRVPESVIDEKVRRILRVKFAMGLFDTTTVRPSEPVNPPAHQTLARQIAEAGIVLLKNERAVLPLDRTALKRVAVIGPLARSAPAGGGSSHVTPPYSVSTLDGVTRLSENQFEIVFAEGCSMAGDLAAVPAAAFKTPTGEPGLKAEYFTNPDLAGRPALTRIDRNIDFNWNDGNPGTGIGNDNFSVRWTGRLVAPAGGSYQLSLWSDDGSRLFIDDKLVIDHWSDHGPEAKLATMTLARGRAYNVRIEYYEKSGGACMRFGWQAPGGRLLARAVAAAKRCDAAIVVAGLNESVEGEGVDRKNIDLPPGQDELIAAIVAANPKTVVVLMNGTPVDMRAWIAKAPAVVEAWYPGMECGNAIANILFGEVNPSGKLPVTFPMRLEDNPSFANYPGDGDKVHYREGVFVGYRHYDVREIAPLFPFGHGLSYTNFTYSNLAVTPIEGGGCEVSFDLANSGARAGAEVAQVYVNDVEASVPRPPRELKAFRKVPLGPGESTRVMLTLGRDAFSYYDTARRDWVLEPGRFRILVGSSSRDIRLEKEIAL
jgi:beta-glucosidase